MNDKARFWSIALIGALALFLYIAYGLLAPGQYNAVFEWPGFYWLTSIRFGVAVISVVIAAAMLTSFVHRRHRRTEAH